MPRLLYFTIFALLHAQALAGQYDTLVSQYTPFLKGHPWLLIPVVAYVESKSNIWVHPSAPKNFPTFQEVQEKDADFTTVVLRLPNGSTFKTYNQSNFSPYPAAVFSGDFNHDDRPDFFAIKGTTACGIAGWYNIGLFAFSEETNSYRFTRIWGWGLGPHNLVIDPKTKGFRFMHTSFRQGKTLDGRYHSFWVHRFFRWEDQFEEDTSLTPIWIQYQYRPHHEPTKLLNTKLKAKIWIEDSGFESRFEW